MDFDWPLGRVWKGFLNPYRGCECPWCADNATTFAHFKATKEEWRQMLDDDFVYHRDGNVVLL